MLSFLRPRDLLRAAQTCQYWRILCEDNLLWREKCREAGIEDLDQMRRQRFRRADRGFNYSPFKVGKSGTNDIENKMYMD